MFKNSGRLDEAQQAYAWFTAYYNRAPESPPKTSCSSAAESPSTPAGRATPISSGGWWATSIRPRSPASQTCGRRRLQSALLFLEKYNEADAAAEIARGLAINPNAAELHAARAEFALSRFDLAAAKRAINRASEINPELLWAHQLLADWYLADLHWTTRSAFCNRR